MPVQRVGDETDPLALPALLVTVGSLAVAQAVIIEVARGRSITAEEVARVRAVLRKAHATLAALDEALPPPPPE